VALSGAALAQGALECRVKLDTADGAQLKHPLDAQVSANDRESLFVNADLSQRHAQLSGAGCVDVIDRAEIDRDPAMAGIECPLGAASQRQHGAGLGPLRERDHRRGATRLVAECRRIMAVLLSAVPFTAVGFARRSTVLASVIWQVVGEL
jgi:hypothetical protein